LKKIDAREFVKISDAAAIVTDGAGTLTGWNRLAEELVSCAGKPTARAQLERIVAIPLDRSLSDGSSKFELSLTRKSGEKVTLEASIVIFHHDTLSPEIVYQMNERVTLRTAGDDRTRAAHPSEQGRDASNGAKLSPRQSQVIRLLASGMSVNEIADSLCISVHTVRSHIRQVLKAFRVHSQTEAIAAAFREGIV